MRKEEGMSDSKNGRGRLVHAATLIGALSLGLGACAGASPDPPNAAESCKPPGASCSFDGDCCSHRCDAETACLGGTP